MTINKQKLFKFYDVWPWALVLGIFTGPSIKAITYNNGHLPLPAWLGIAGVLLAGWGISIFRFFLRQQWINSIIYYTDHGIAVFSDGKVPIIPNVSDLDKATEEVVSFWNNRNVNGKTISASDCYNVINGSTLGLSSVPIDIEGGPDFKSKLVRGYDIGSQMGIYVDPKSYNETIRVFKHELGHLCLDTIGLTDETAAHKTMSDNGFNY